MPVACRLSELVNEAPAGCAADRGQRRSDGRLDQRRTDDGRASRSLLPAPNPLLDKEQELLIRTDPTSDVAYVQRQRLS